MKHMKWLSVLGAVVMSLAVLTGCSSSTQTPAQKADQKVTVMLPEWGVPPQDMLDEFQKESGVTVEVQTTSWDDIKSKVSMASAGKKAPADVFEVDWSWAGEFGKAGWLEKQTPDDATLKDVPTYSYFKVGDAYYATPYVNDLRFAYWNAAMAQKAGITTAPTTQDELEQSLLAIKGQGDVPHPYLFPLTAEEKTTTSFITLAYVRNGKVFNDDGTLNKESVLDTMTVLKKYIDTGLIDPNNVMKPGIDVFRGINNGDGAFFLGPTSYTTSTNDPKASKVVGQVEPIPIPGKTGPSPKTIAFPEALGISAFSQNKEAAKKFVDWYTSKDTQLKLNKAINNPPTRISALDEMAQGKNETAQAAEVILNQLQIVSTPFPHGVPPYYTKMSTEIFNTINQLGQGKISAEDATNQLVEKVNAIVKAN